MPQNPLLKLQSISKSYPGCLANDAIDLRINKGEIHALLGENGAGKSTLVKIIYGVLRADSGSLIWQGMKVQINNPAIARQLGIAMVFQHFSLFDSLTVLENIALGMDKQQNRETLQREITEVSELYGLPLDPQQYVYTLSVGERQRIEIVRCLIQKPKLLVMDEPTSVLTPQEVQKLFDTLRRLAKEGMAILYISHKLEEIRQLCDRATLLRDGKRIAETIPQEETVQSLANLMIGGEVERIKTQSIDSSNTNPVRLEVNNLNIHMATNSGISLHNISFQVRGGEIVGIAGVAGNGQVELLEALTGEKRSKANAVKINQIDCGELSSGERRKLGMCCVPEERLGHATVPEMSLSENTFLTAFERLNMLGFGLIQTAQRNDFADRIISEFSVRCSGRESPASSLSGGNLQKFIVGREVRQQPDLLLISQPTWGVDIAAAVAIHQSLIALAKQGAAVLIISQDLDELLAISHRIGALCAGRLSDLYQRSEVSIQDIGLLMGGGTLNPMGEVSSHAD